ncbi:unnamed protein product [Discosporangium mesarthrocarpum]
MDTYMYPGSTWLLTPPSCRVIHMKPGSLPALQVQRAPFHYCTMCCSCPPLATSPLLLHCQWIGLNGVPCYGQIDCKAIENIPTVSLVTNTKHTENQAERREVTAKSEVEVEGSIPMKYFRWKKSAPLSVSICYVLNTEQTKRCSLAPIL